MSVETKHDGKEEAKPVEVATSTTSNSAPFNKGDALQTPMNATQSRGKLCRFYASGQCKNGNTCTFIHSDEMVQQQQQSYGAMSYESVMNANAYGQAPAPVFVTTPPGAPIYSIDVECVATSVQHTGRSVAQVALVNEWCQPVFNVLIKQEQKVVSYITELTGLTEEIVEKDGHPLAEALASLREHLPPNAILVGQNILKDVQWLQLAEGVDYAGLIDLSALFRVWNPQRNEYTSFSQDHCAKVWLGIQDRPHHDAVSDSQISMTLFNAYRNIQMDPFQLSQMQAITLSAPRTPGFSSIHPSIDGCCMGNRKKCTCGAPFFN